MKYVKNLLSAVGLVTAIGFAAFMLSPGPTFALANTLTGITARQISVGTTAEPATNDTGKKFGWKSCLIWNNSTTPLYVGDSSVDATNNMPICTDTANCVSAYLSVDGRDAFVRASVGTLTPKILCGR